MQKIEKMMPEKISELQALRRQLGSKITSAAALLEEQEGRGIRWSSGREDWDEALGGGWARGQLTEIIAPTASSGGGLVMARLLRQVRLENRYALLIDVGCAFSTESIPAVDLETLLWVGCRSVPEAMEVFDVASRDENFHLFMVDLRNSDPSDWRSVRAGQWYRILGQLRQREAVAVMFSRCPVTAAAKHRYELAGRLAFESLEHERQRIFPAVSWRQAVRDAGRNDARSAAGGVLRAG
jgi:hypothetical protein